MKKLWAKLREWIRRLQNPWTFTWNDLELKIFLGRRQKGAILWEEVGEIVALNRLTVAVPVTTVWFYRTKEDTSEIFVDDLMPSFYEFAEWLPTRFKGLPQNWRDLVEVPPDKENRLTLWRKT